MHIAVGDKPRCLFLTLYSCYQNGDPILGKRNCGNEIIPIISCDLFIIGLTIACGT